MNLALNHFFHIYHCFHLLIYQYYHFFEEFYVFDLLFYQIHKKRNVLFTFKGEDLPKNTESVQICGSYDKWNVRHPLKYDKARNLWFVNLTLNRGKIFYKYIVNSKWVVNPREEVDNDGNNENNVIVL